MKTLEQYITEKLKIKNTVDKNKTKYTLFPESKGELKKMIQNEIDRNGPECSLNHIDVSGINDMSYLFFDELEDFDGDISEWDVSNVINMGSMFYVCAFTGKHGDISDWDVSSVENMSGMFYKSHFYGDISKWDVSSVKDMSWMFCDCIFNGDISDWDVSNVTNMLSMFNNNKSFNKDISKWDVSSVKDMSHMFRDSKVKCDISGWNVSNVEKSRYAFADSYYATHPKLLPKQFTT